MRYMTVAVVVPGDVAEHTCYTYEEMGETINEAVLFAARSGLPVEVFVLIHEHDPTPEDDCDCELYLRDAGPFMTFNRKEVLEKDC